MEYFHVELDTHDVIIAEGAPSESFIDDDSRGMFHNAQEYDTLYADEVRQPACYCAPRLDEGYEIENVRRRIARAPGCGVPPTRRAPAGCAALSISSAPTASRAGRRMSIIPTRRSVSTLS